MAGVKGRSGRPAQDATSAGLSTRWKPGQTGNPAGSSKKERLTALLRRKLEAVVDPTNPDAGTVGDKVVEALLTEAKSGNVRAIQEVFDRSDGKVKSELDLGGSLGLTTYDLSGLSAKELAELERIVSRVEATATES